jgi:peptidoglycan/LPS O-acetylase OafA/YrhL
LIFYYFHKPFSLNASFFKTLFLIPGHYTIIPVSWSLSYELYFYLLFGFWTLIPDDKIRRLVFRIFLGISTLVVMTHVTVFSFKGTVFNFFFGQNIWEFLLGIFAGYIYQKKEFLQFNKTFWFVTALALFCFISLPFRNAGSSLVYGICGGLLVWSAARLNHSARGIHSLFSISGQASYSIYLISPLALGIFGRRSVLEAGILILAVSIAGIIINRFYEEPMLKRIRGLLVKRVQDPKKE